VKSVQEVLKQKENDLQVIQKEIEALRLVVRLLAGDDEPEEVRPINMSHVQADNPWQATADVWCPTLTLCGEASTISRFFPDERRTRQSLRDGLQPLFWYCRGVTRKSVAQTFAEHPFDVGLDGQKAPLMVVGRYGIGRTLFSAIDDSWRWRYYTGENVFNTYWVQQLRFLARGKKIGSRGHDLQLDLLAVPGRQPGRGLPDPLHDAAAGVGAEREAARRVVQLGGAEQGAEGGALALGGEAPDGRVAPRQAVKAQVGQLVVRRDQGVGETAADLGASLQALRDPGRRDHEQRPGHRPPAARRQPPVREQQDEEQQQYHGELGGCSGQGPDRAGCGPTPARASRPRR